MTGMDQSPLTASQHERYAEAWACADAMEEWRKEWPTGKG